ncbi:condensation domain-containing protein, partial [Acidobacteriota bacterium]
YNNVNIINLDGKIEKDRLEKAFEKLIARHESLRNSFESTTGRPVQRIHEQVNFSIEFDHLDGRDAGLEESMRRFMRPFDLSKAPLFRIKCIRIAEERYILLYDIFHIITDAASQTILSRDFLSLYSGRELPVLRLQYKDFAAWQNSDAHREVIKKEKEYWVKLFSEPYPLLDLPTDFPRPEIQSSAGASVGFRLSEEETMMVKKVAQEAGATIYMCILALFDTLLSKLCRQEEIIVGTPVAGRAYTELENAVGMFVNTLAIRSYPVKDKTFREFGVEVKHHNLEAFENQDFQFEDLVDSISVRRDTGRNPVFDVMVNLVRQVKHPGDGPVSEDERPPSHKPDTAKFDLNVEIMDFDRRVYFELEYCTRLFKPETIDRWFIRYFKNLLNKLTLTPNQYLKEIELLDEDEKHKLLYEFNDTRREYPEDRTIPALFEDRAEKFPGKMTLIDGNRIMTYNMLNECANRLAGYLKDGCGVKKKETTGLFIPRSLELVTGILAVLKAGTLCLYIDIKYPRKRVDLLLRDSDAEAVIKLKGYNFDSGLTKGRRVVEIEPETLNKFPAENSEGEHNAHDPAYLVYTSGSTGLPKGVVLFHAGIINHTFTKVRMLGLKQEDIFCHNLSFSFVASIWQIFAPLFLGARLVIYPEHIIIDSYRLFRRAAGDRISILEVMPSFLNNYLEILSGGSEKVQLKPLRMLILTGEKVTPGLVDKFYDRYKIGLVNAYGQSECSDDTLHYEIPVGSDTLTAPVGKPSDNTNMLIFGRDSQLQPVGVPGELCIGGMGLTAGYLNRIELTEEKFIPHPFARGEKLFRTGDLVS